MRSPLPLLFAARCGSSFDEYQEMQAKRYERIIKAIPVLKGAERYITNIGLVGDKPQIALVKEEVVPYGVIEHLFRSAGPGGQSGSYYIKIIPSHDAPCYFRAPHRLDRKPTPSQNEKYYASHPVASNSPSREKMQVAHRKARDVYHRSKNQRAGMEATR